MFDATDILAVSPQLREFREAEHAFVNAGRDKDQLFETAVQLAERARSLGALPEDILRAMRLAGCIRSDQIRASDTDRASRYWIALSAVLEAFYLRTSDDGVLRTVAPSRFVG